jgi:glycolate oxidase FAD binding subunit
MSVTPSSLPVVVRSASTLAPTTEQELALLVHDSAAAGRPLVTMGSGTKRHLGPSAAPGAAALTMRQLARVTSYEPGDLVVSVQAGARLADLQRTLALRGQWLAIDPPHAEATIGGILATASAGPRRFGYGTARDHLLGMRVVGPSGAVTKSGGRVVKNVTGYDLHKLHVGAFGTLGVIVEAHFKVQPRPEVSSAVVFGCASIAQAHRLLLEVWGSALRPVALELSSAATGAYLRGSMPGLPPGEALAVVGVEGTRPVFERHLRDLEGWRGKAGGMAVLRGPAAERLWAAYRDLPDRHRDDVVVRVGARPHDLPALLDEVAAAPGASVQVHAGNGIARVYLRPAGGHTAEIAALISGWHQRAAVLGGYAVVEAAPVEIEGRALLPWGAATHPLARAIKQKWDPAQILNPGRVAL